MSPIEYIAGRVEACGPDWAVIDLHGLGMRINVPLSTAEALTAGDETRLWCHLYIREDIRALYGFRTTAERDLFVQLLGVTGVGPRMALAAISLHGPDQLAAIIDAEDADALTRIRGIGKKTASQIVLDLRGKIRAPDGVVMGAAGGSLVEALIGYGFSRSDAAALLAKLPPDPDRSEAETLRLAFQAHGARTTRSH